jgi:hypothetical protein
LQYVKGTEVYPDFTSVFEKFKREYPPVTGRDLSTVEEAALGVFQSSLRNIALDKMLQRLIKRNVRKELWSPTERVEFDQRMRQLEADRSAVRVAYRRLKYLRGERNPRYRKLMRQNGEVNGQNAV